MSKSLDRLTLLETFVRISERGSISAAARDLNLSQATASRQLMELEDRLAVDLVRRTTHSLALTLAGRSLLAEARTLLSGWEMLEERHAPADRSVKGPLKVVAPVALGQGHLADIALQFQLDNPAVSLEWHLEDEAIRFAEVGCDLWIKVGPVPDDRLIVRPLASIERLVVGRSDLRPDLRPEEAGDTIDRLGKTPFVALSPFEGGRIGLTGPAGRQAELRPPLNLTTNNIFAVKRAVLMGVGAAVLPRWFIADELAAGTLVDLAPSWRAARLPLSAAYLPARHQARRLRHFLDALSSDLVRIPGLDAAPEGA